MMMMDDEVCAVGKFQESIGLTSLTQNTNKSLVRTSTPGLLMPLQSIWKPGMVEVEEELLYQKRTFGQRFLLQSM